MTWIAVDWGTSNLRAWQMEGAREKGHAGSDAGMATLKPEEFEPALLDLIAPWLGEGAVTVVACGMVGAKQGWAEAAYRKVPCPPSGAGLVRAPVRDGRLEVHLVPGICQDSPADVMRGEETQIAGFLAQNPGYDGILCLPGTHTKWVHVSAGEIVSFRTMMTGELFALLSRQSVLRHSTAGDGFDDEAFAEAASDSLSRPEALAARAFSIRAGDLLHGTPAATARARLSGLLVGAELAAAKPYWLGQPVTLIGAPALARIYARALADQGAAPAQAAGDALTLAGLTAIWQGLGKTPDQGPAPTTLH
jgi:2-dehydro-3-deoxygalactonokinase